MRIRIFFLAIFVCGLFLGCPMSDSTPTFNEKEFREKLKGKTVSILGDSLTSFGPPSNGLQSTTTTTDGVIGAWYGNGQYNASNGNETGVSAQNQMFWGKFIETYEMELLVNNSIGGSGVIKNSGLHEDLAYLGGNDGNNRIKGLTKVKGVAPDIIIISGSGNDLDKVPLGNWDSNIEELDINSVPTNFEEAYAVMLKRIKAEYPNTDVWCITLHDNFGIPPKTTSDKLDNFYPYPYNGGKYGATVPDINNSIRKVTTAFGYNVLDLEEAMDYTTYTSHKYDSVHPNATGHLAMYAQMVKDFSEVYGKE